MKVDISCTITFDLGPIVRILYYVFESIILCIRIYNAKKKNHDLAKH